MEIFEPYIFEISTLTGIVSIPMPMEMCFSFMFSHALENPMGIPFPQAIQFPCITLLDQARVSMEKIPAHMRPRKRYFLTGKSRLWATWRRRLLRQVMTSRCCWWRHQVIQVNMYRYVSGKYRCSCYSSSLLHVRYCWHTLYTELHTVFLKIATPLCFCHNVSKYAKILTKIVPQCLVGNILSWRSIHFLK